MVLMGLFALQLTQRHKKRCPKGAAKIQTFPFQVAIKKIPKVFDDLVDGKRILREIKLLTYLEHENIISVKVPLRDCLLTSTFSPASGLVQTSHQAIRRHLFCFRIDGYRPPSNYSFQAKVV